MFEHRVLSAVVEPCLAGDLFDAVVGTTSDEGLRRP
jgi:hypothetical protein